MHSESPSYATAAAINSNKSTPSRNRGEDSHDEGNSTSSFTMNAGLKSPLSFPNPHQGTQPHHSRYHTPGPAIPSMIVRSSDDARDQVNDGTSLYEYSHSQTPQWERKSNNSPAEMRSDAVDGVSLISSKDDSNVKTNGIHADSNVPNHTDNIDNGNEIQISTYDNGNVAEEVNEGKEDPSETDPAASKQFTWASMLRGASKK